MTVTKKPFKILGIQQIAIGGQDKNELKKLWVDMLGFQFKSTFVSERENVDEDICAIGAGVHEIELDLMQPLDIEKKPAVHQTPLNHIGLWVDDLSKAVECGVICVRIMTNKIFFHIVVMVHLVGPLPLFGFLNKSLGLSRFSAGNY